MPSSNYPKYFDINIANVLEHLEIEDSLKEVISNALDEHILSESKRDIRIYKNDNNNWCIRDHGRGIKPSNFKFDINNDKQDNHDIIGMYGYGLKDAIGNLFHREIKFKIYTRSYIFTPIMRPKEDFPDQETIHMEIIKNTTYEIKKGTEFVFDNLTLENITKAKEKFMKFLKPNILFEIDDYKIFKLDTFQSIFVNGVEVHKNTGFHFSYDIKSSDNIRKCFNRDRKQLNLPSLKPHIIKVLKQLKIFNKKDDKDDDKKNDDDKDDDKDDDNNKDDKLFNNIRNILKVSTPQYLQEFNQIDVLRNIITQINSLNKYVFVGSKEKLTKTIKEKIKDDNKENFVLGDGVKSKFLVKYIKDLYFNSNFDKNLDNNIHINTLINYIDNTHQPINISDYISNIIKPIEKLFKIPEDLKIKLLNIEVINSDDSDDNSNDNSDDNSNNSDDSDSDSDSDDDTNSFEKDGYDFSGEKLKLSNKYINEKMKKDLFVILFRYIVDTVDDDVIKKMGDKMDDNDNNNSRHRSWWKPFM